MISGQFVIASELVVWSYYQSDSDFMTVNSE